VLPSSGPDPVPAQPFSPTRTTAVPGVEERLQKLEAEVRDLKLARLSEAKDQIGLGPGLAVASETEPGPEIGPERLGLAPTTKTRLPVPPGPSQIRPVKLIRSLQHQFFGAKADFSSEVFALGNVVTAGIVRPHVAGQLLELYVNMALHSCFSSRH
jgi:hypothetical protein